mgnify:CR=1 FL=1
MDDRRYLQRTDGDSEYDRIVRIKRSDRKRNKNNFLQQKSIKCKKSKVIKEQKTVNPLIMEFIAILIRGFFWLAFA